jgi:hypothetical protein
MTFCRRKELPPTSASSTRTLRHDEEDKDARNRNVEATPASFHSPGMWKLSN